MSRVKESMASEDYALRVADMAVLAADIRFERIRANAFDGPLNGYARTQKADALQRIYDRLSSSQELSDAQP